MAQISLKIKEKEITIGNVCIKFRSDWDTETRQMLDTAVIIDNDVLCWISGDSIDEFIKNLVNLVNEYHI